MGLIKRTDIVSFLDTTPTEATPTWALIGDGMTTGAISYDAATTTETYIIHNSASTTVDSYTVSFEGEMKCIKGDDVFDFIDGLRISRAIGDNCKSHILNVYKYDVTDEKYKAEMNDCVVTVSSFGGDGGATPTISFKIDMVGDNTIGTATISSGTPTFTASV